MSAAERLREWREAEGWTQMRAAEHLHIHPPVYALVEKGRLVPNDRVRSILHVRANIPMTDWPEFRDPHPVNSNASREPNGASPVVLCHGQAETPFPSIAEALEHARTRRLNQATILRATDRVLLGGWGPSAWVDVLRRKDVAATRAATVAVDTAATAN